jgi:hypothetical protein
VRSDPLVYASRVIRTDGVVNLICKINGHDMHATPMANGGTYEWCGVCGLWFMWPARSR